MKSVYITYSEGCCWRRVLDAKVLNDYFLINKYRLTNNVEEADIIILVTCAFIEKTEDIAMNKVCELKKYSGRLIVGGCLPAINPQRLEKEFNGEIFAANNMQKIDFLFPQSNVKFDQISDSNKLYTIKSSNRYFRAFLNIAKYYFPNFFNLQFHKNFYNSLIKAYKVNKDISGNIFYIRTSWGCGGFPMQPHCTYCVEWKAVGNFKSKNRQKCLNEFHEGLKKGYKKISLLADNTGAYGEDTGDTLTSLLKTMLNESPDDISFIIDSLHPVFLIKYIDEWIDIFKTKRVKWIMTPIQSGDDNILKTMLRQHTTQQFKDVIIKILDSYPKIQISTQVIIGFPGETDESFENTLIFLKECRFFNVVLFPYSKIPGTVAGELDNQVHPDVIALRIKRAKKFLEKNGIFHFHLKLNI